MFWPEPKKQQKSAKKCLKRTFGPCLVENTAKKSENTSEGFWGEGRRQGRGLTQQEGVGVRLNMGVWFACAWVLARLNMGHSDDPRIRDDIIIILEKGKKLKPSKCRVPFGDCHDSRHGNQDIFIFST